VEHRQFQHLLAIRESSINAARAHYQASGLPEAAVPVLVGITGACENVSTLFHVAGGARVHLTQTGQLALEHALCMSKGIYCITPSFRTDKIDERHLHEFTLIEEEISCEHPAIGMSRDAYDSAQMFEALLARITGSVKAILRGCLTNAPEAITELGGRPEYLADVVDTDFYRISYSDAIEMLNKKGDEEIQWGTDLGAAQERSLVELMAQEHGGVERPTFVTHYPQAIKFFNMKVDDENPAVVQSADLLLPGPGESVGSAVREHRYDLLVDRLTSSTMFAHIVEQKLATLDDFMPYLEVIRGRRTAPHAGYGIGLERVIQFMMGGSDIRAASVSFGLTTMMGWKDVMAAAQSGSRAPGF
jgi:asparaginyl-tRNA synthetase